MLLEFNDIYLVRGKLRCHILNNIAYFDDYDIIVTNTNKEILSTLDKYNIDYFINFFGNPKIKYNNGIVFDIWSLQAQNVLRIEDALDQFAFNLDSLALNIKTLQLIGQQKCIDQIKNRTLDFQQKFIDNANSTDISYHMFKAAYLIIRHDLKIGKIIELYINMPFKLYTSQKIYIYNLIKELRLLNICQNKISKIELLANDSMNKGNFISLNQLI